MKNLSLIVDIGNTTTVFGLFYESDFVCDLLTYTSKNTIDEKEKKLAKFLYENDYEVSRGMIFSVVPFENEKIRALIKKVCNIDVEIFDAKTYEGLKTNVDNPKEIGADLIADLVGANTIYGFPNLIIDLGTVTKILYTNKDGVFEGCSFLPGLQTSLSLFNEKTALLPEINEFKIASFKLGKNTVDAMMHGVFWSTVSFIQKGQEEYVKDAKLILTGGNCHAIATEIKDKIVDPNLTIKGMNILFREIHK